MRSKVFFCFVLLIGLCSCQYVGTSCSYQYSVDENWDLLPLQYNPSASAIPAGCSYNSTENRDVISINFCAQVSPFYGCTSSTSTNPPVAAPGGCQTQYDVTNPQVLGDATNATFSVVDKAITSGPYTFTEGVILTYNQGSFCQAYNNYRSIDIAVVCPPEGYTGPLEQIIDTAEPGECVYQVVFPSVHGCSYSLATHSHSPTPSQTSSVTPSSSSTPSASLTPSTSISPSPSPSPLGSSSSENGGMSTAWAIILGIVVGGFVVAVLFVVGAAVFYKFVWQKKQANYDAIE